MFLTTTILPLILNSGRQSGRSGAEGSAEALTHARVAKRQDSTKHSCFLFDTDAQKPVFDTGGKAIKSLAKAQSLGLISKQGKAGREAKEKPPSEPGQKKGGELATVVQPSKGAIIFTLGEHQISLNPQYLYDAYLYYEDIVLRENIDVEFSVAIKDCLKYAWERLNQHRGQSGRP